MSQNLYVISPKHSSTVSVRLFIKGEHRAVQEVFLDTQIEPDHIKKYTRIFKKYFHNQLNTAIFNCTNFGQHILDGQRQEEGQNEDKEKTDFPI